MDNRRMNNGRKKKEMGKKEISVEIEVERTSGENFKRRRERVLSLSLTIKSDAFEC